MSSTEDRVIELLSERALGTLEDPDHRELAALLAKHPELDTDALDIAAAAIDLSAVSGSLEAMPKELEARVERAIAKEIAATMHGASKTVRIASAPEGEGAKVVPIGTAVTSAPVRTQRPARRSVLAWTGWIAAAASIAFAVGTWAYTHRGAATVASERARILALSGTVESAFAAATDPSAAGASGDVVWNGAEQRGFMRFRGLATNDRAAWEYQLWIFDETRDDRYPVDGGVFDIDTKSGDVIIPIRAKIDVAKAKQFVVTAEKPGGVVVSKRERVVMAAKI